MIYIYMMDGTCKYIFSEKQNDGCYIHSLIAPIRPIIHRSS